MIEKKHEENENSVLNSTGREARKSNILWIFPAFLAIIAIWLGYLYINIPWLAVSITGALTLFFLFSLYRAFRENFDEKGGLIKKYSDKYSKQLIIGLLIILLVIGTFYVLPKFVYFSRNNSLRNVIQEYSRFSTANLSSKHYTESIFTPEPEYLEINYVLTEEANNPIFVAKHSYTGNEKWFVYGRLKELGILSEKVATTKIMYPSHNLRFPFVGGLANWKSNADYLSDYGFSVEKYSEAQLLPEPGDILLWDTVKDDSNNTMKFGHLAFVEKVINEKVYISESRMVIQNKATDTPKLPEGIQYVIICEKLQSVLVDSTSKDIYGVKLYKDHDTISGVVATLNKFQVMRVLEKYGPQDETCWIRTKQNKLDSKNTIENPLTQETKERMWYKLQNLEDESIIGWALLEDRNQPDEKMKDVHSIEHNFTGIGIYGHEPFMYDLEDAYIIRTPTSKKGVDFKDWD